MVSAGNKQCGGCLKVKDGQGGRGATPITMGGEDPRTEEPQRNAGLWCSQKKAKVRLQVSSVRRRGCAEDAWRII
jgi:hypothetical protein